MLYGPEPVSDAPKPEQDEKQKKELPPSLLWDADTEIDPDNADYAALMALKEELTPDERAEALKEQGNECLKRKRPFYYREAIKCYTSALEEKSGHAEHNAVYLSNRAHAQLLLGNHAKALADARQAIALNDANVKAYYRAAKAAMALRRFEDALEFSEGGLKRDPENSELRGFLRSAAEELAAERMRELRVSEAEKEADKLVVAIRERGLRLGRPHYGSGDVRPWLDDRGRMHWRVLLLYPETMQMDTIEDACETDLLSVHLDEMFGPAAPPLPWDREGAYSRDRVQLIAEVGHAPWSTDRLRAWLLEGTAASVGADKPPEDGADRSADSDVKRVLVPETKAILDVIKQDRFVIPGIPVFLVVSRGSEFAKVVLSGKWQVPLR